MMAKDQFATAYQEWLDRQNEPVPEEVWDNVATALDLDEVWSNVRSTLDQAPPEPASSTSSSRYWWMLGAITLIYFMGIFPLNPEPKQGWPHHFAESVWTPTALNKDKRASSSSAVSSSTSPHLEQVDTITSARPKSLGAAPLPEEIQHAVGGNPQEIQAKHANAALAIATTSKTNNDVQQAHNASLMAVEVDTTPASQLAQLVPAGWVQKELQTYSISAVFAAQQEEFPIKLLHVGIITGIKNTWLLNPETAYGLNPSTLSDTRATWAPEAGITMEALLWDKHHVGINLLLVSPVKQNYRQYINARYTNRTIQLNRQRLQLYYAQPMAAGTAITGGLYVARLSRASEQIGNYSSNTITGNYRQWDYGVTAGVRQSFPLWGRLSIDASAQVVLGIPNIYRGSTLRPVDLNITREASFNLSTRLIYNW